MYKNKIKILTVFIARHDSKTITEAASSNICNMFSAHHTYTHPFNGPLSRTTEVSRYQKDKTNLDFAEARDSGWHLAPDR